MTTPADSLLAIETEAALLGAMLLDNALVDEFAGALGVKDFAEPVHGRIYSALLRFRARGAVANAMTLRPVFQNDPSALGGDYLSKLADTEALVVGAKDFATQLVDLANRRRARDHAQTAIDRLQSDFDATVPEIVAPVHDAGMASIGVEEAPARSAAAMVGVVRERARRISAGEQSTGATNALVSDIDRAIGPLEPGYIVLAGRPGMGKTALADSLAQGYAMNGHPGLYLQGEMSEEQQAMRVVSNASHAFGRGIPHSDIRHNKLDDGQLNWLGRVEDKLANLPLDYRAVGHMNIRQIEALVARHCALWLARGKKLSFVVLDQMSFVTATDAEGREIDDDRKRMNAVSKAIAAMSKRLDVAIIALAQLSRTLEARANKRPTLPDLKETGKLEEDADVVLFIYREEYYLKDAEPKKGVVDKGVNLWEEWEIEFNKCRGKAELIVAKNRHDETRTRTLKYHGKYFAMRGSDHDDWDDDSGFDTSVRTFNFEDPNFLSSLTGGDQP